MKLCMLVADVQERVVEGVKWKEWQGIQYNAGKERVHEDRDLA